MFQLQSKSLRIHFLFLTTLLNYSNAKLTEEIKSVAKKSKPATITRIMCKHAQLQDKIR